MGSTGSCVGCVVLDSSKLSSECSSEIFSSSTFSSLSFCVEQGVAFELPCDSGEDILLECAN